MFKKQFGKNIAFVLNAKSDRDDSYVLGGSRGVHTKKEKEFLVHRKTRYYVDGTSPGDFSEEERVKVQEGMSVHAVTGVFQGKIFDNSKDEHPLFVDYITSLKGERFIILKHDDLMIKRAISSFDDGVDSASVARMPDATRGMRNGEIMEINRSDLYHATNVLRVPSINMIDDNAKSALVSALPVEYDGNKPIKVIEFGNSYTGYGSADFYLREMREGDGTTSLEKDVAVFWTKQQVQNDEFDLPFEKLDDKLIRKNLGKRFVRFPLSGENSLSAMIGAKNSNSNAPRMWIEHIMSQFIKANNDVKEVHIWIQGSLTFPVYSKPGKGGKQKFLRMAKVTHEKLVKMFGQATRKEVFDLSNKLVPSSYNDGVVSVADGDNLLEDVYKTMNLIHRHFNHEGVWWERKYISLEGWDILIGLNSTSHLWNDWRASAKKASDEDVWSMMIGVMTIPLKWRRDVSQSLDSDLLIGRRVLRYAKEIITDDEIVNDNNETLVSVFLAVAYLVSLMYNEYTIIVDGELVWTRKNQCVLVNLPNDTVRIIHKIIPFAGMYMPSKAELEVHSQFRRAKPDEAASQPSDFKMMQDAAVSLYVTVAQLVPNVPSGGGLSLSLTEGTVLAPSGAGKSSFVYGLASYEVRKAAIGTKVTALNRVAVYERVVSSNVFKESGLNYLRSSKRTTYLHRYGSMLSSDHNLLSLELFGDDSRTFVLPLLPPSKLTKAFRKLGDKKVSQLSLAVAAQIFNESNVLMMNDRITTTLFIPFSPLVRMIPMSVAELLASDYDYGYIQQSYGFVAFPIMRTFFAASNDDEMEAENLKATYHMITATRERSFRQFYEEVNRPRFEINPNHLGSTTVVFAAEWISPMNGHAGITALCYREAFRPGRRGTDAKTLSELGSVKASGHALAALSAPWPIVFEYCYEVFLRSDGILSPFAFNTLEPVSKGPFHTQEEYNVAAEFTDYQYTNGWPSLTTVFKLCVENIF